ncbi:MAG: class I SAM-dependent methyltransferase [bacterium]
MEALLETILEHQQVTDESGNTLPLHSALPPIEGAILQAWLGRYRPTRIIEIGLAYGLSSLFICEALKEWEIDSYQIIDPNQSHQWNNIGRLNLERAGYQDLYTFHETPSEIQLPRLLESGHIIDFAFVDGLHTFDQVLLEFYYLNRMLEVGGVIVFDDVHLPALQRILSYIDNYDCYERLEIPSDPSYQTQLKVRKVMNICESRIVGYQKTAQDTRDGVWFSEF